MKLALLLSNSLSTRLLTVIALFTPVHALCVCSHKLENFSLQFQSTFTCFGSKADIVMFKHVAQNEPAAAVNSTIWVDCDMVTTRQTADHVNGGFEVVCRSMKDHVISPRAICHHVLKVISPRNTSMHKVEQFRPIRLQEKEITRKKTN